MSPDYFLSQHGIRYDGVGLPGTPVEIVEALQKLNSTRTWDESTNSFEYNHYVTPDFVAVDTNPNTFSSSWIRKETQAIEEYTKAKNAGDIEAAHKAVDKINKVRMVKGGRAFEAHSDFEIYCSAQNYIGEVARELVKEQAAAEENQTSTPWFFTLGGFNDLLFYRSAVSNTIDTADKISRRR